MRPWLEGGDPAGLGLDGWDAVDDETQRFLAWARDQAERLGPVLGDGILGFIDGDDTCELLGLWLPCIEARGEWADALAASPEGGAS